MPNSCIVIGCKRRGGQDGVKLYQIPAKRSRNTVIHKKDVQDLSERRQDLWLSAISRKEITSDTITKNHRVCNAHFLSGKF